MKCENCLGPYTGDERILPRICDDCIRNGDFRVEPVGSYS